MFLTDFLKAIVQQGAADSITDTEFLQYELNYWINGPTRTWQLDGERYYHYESDILTKQRTMIGAGGAKVSIPNLPNNQLQDNRYAFLVDQKTNYLLAKPMEPQAENTVQDDKAKDIFGPAFIKEIKNVGKDCLNCGISYIFPYVDAGTLKFKRFHGYEVLPFWADDEHTILDAAARLYMQEVYEGNQKRFIPCVEWYTVDGVQKFTFIGGQLELQSADITPYMVVNDEAGQDAKGYNWGKIPLVAFKANEEEIPLIKRVKSLQDALNSMYSDFADHMQEDVWHSILIIKNAGGTDLAQFRTNAAQYGAVNVDTGEGGGVESLSIDVNSDNYTKIIDMLKSAIIENGRGLDMKDEKLAAGSPNQMNIQSMYNDIDLDADEMEMEFQASLQQLMWFVKKIYPDIGDVSFVFNRDRLMNQDQIINDCKLSTGIISDETIVSNHPWTTDTQEELARIKKEKAADLQQFMKAGGTGAAQPAQVTSKVNITDDTEV